MNVRQQKLQEYIQKGEHCLSCLVSPCPLPLGEESITYVSGVSCFMVVNADRSVSAAKKQEIHVIVDVPHKARGQSQPHFYFYGAGFD